eukprot:SAG31_NODE_3916_length_3753_cov_2.384131_4_plen_396_part_00
MAALRAVILLPTQDLARQVFQVFEALIQGAGLDLALSQSERTSAQHQLVSAGSAVDIVVATPGRLVASMKRDGGKDGQYSLNQLRWLVIDDADRLLQQSFQDWVPTVMGALPKLPAMECATTGARKRPPGLSACNWAVLRDPGRHSVQAIADGGSGLRKLVLSATLTQNPAKLFALQLNHPLSLHATEDTAARYVLPARLTEQAMVIPTHLKPLAVVQILHDFAQMQHQQDEDGTMVGGSKMMPPATVIFASTVEATHRLFRLLQLFGPFTVAEYSSKLSSARRAEILSQLANGHVHVVVCSDVMTRGIDVAAIRLVINYDNPSHVKTYIHRVGRTARAGKGGTAVTLLRREDGAYQQQTDNCVIGFGCFRVADALPVVTLIEPVQFHYVHPTFI